MCFTILSRKYKRDAFREETYHLLNYYTLSIRDKQIEREYEQYRINRMNELFWPCFAMTSIFFVGGWLSSFLGGSTN